MPSLDNLNHGNMPSTSFQSAILSADAFGHISSSGNSSKREGDHETFEQREERRKKRKSRWASEDSEKTQIPGMPTVIPTNLTKEQEEAYVLQLQIEEISRKLRTGDLGIPANPEERSPSPEPIYGFDGKRMNTREYRTRKKLEEERHQLICRMFKTNPDFKPPADYKPPLTRVSDKVMIPQDVYPDINFVGLLIGPRGNTLKSMEHETGAKIIIRGKGSVKEGKVGRKDGQPLPGENEPLHAYVTANNPEFVKKAVEKIKEIIRQGVEVPEGQNDLRRQQLRELALLNGTLRENEGMRCTNCGASDHKSWTCPDKPNVTMQVICTTCGGAGHIAKDCRQKRPGMGYPPTVYPGIGIGSTSHQQQQQNPMDKAKIDEEYMSLMAELGEGPPPNRDNSRGGNYDRNRGPSSSGGLFDRPSVPRAIAAPGPGPAHTSLQHIPNNLPPPPWSQQSSKLPAPNSSSSPNQPPSSSSAPNMMHGSGWQGPPGCSPYQYYPNGPPNNQQWMGSANDARPPSSWSYGGGNNSDSRSGMNNSWAPPYNASIPSNIHGLLTAPPPPPPPPPSSS